MILQQCYVFLIIFSWWHKFECINCLRILINFFFRREREELARQRGAAAYQKLHAAGATEEARADLARLALVRQQREEAARRREQEKQSKESKGKPAAKQAPFPPPPHRRYLPTCLSTTSFCNISLYRADFFHSQHC